MRECLSPAVQLLGATDTPTVWRMGALSRSLSGIDCTREQEWTVSLSLSLSLSGIESGSGSSIERSTGRGLEFSSARALEMLM